MTVDTSHSCEIRRPDLLLQALAAQHAFDRPRALPRLADVWRFGGAGVLGGVARRW